MHFCSISNVFSVDGAFLFDFSLNYLLTLHAIATMDMFTYSYVCQYLTSSSMYFLAKSAEIRWECQSTFSSGTIAFDTDIMRMKILNVIQSNLVLLEHTHSFT